MKRPLKIAVVSDNHIDIEVEPDSWELAKAAFKKVAAANVDHVVIAGDLFDCATAMHRDRDQVERFLSRLGLWHRDRLSIVVGNHDIFQGEELRTAKQGSKEGGGRRHKARGRGEVGGGGGGLGRLPASRAQG